MDKQYFKTLENGTPVFADFVGLFDADDELRPIAQRLTAEGDRSSNLDVNRIKFLYGDKPKKQGRYVIFEIEKRSEKEKMCNPDYDFIVTVFYDVWKMLDGEHKVIALDKALCSMDIEEKPDKPEKPVKKGPDTMEYKENMYRFGPDKVMRASETIDMACINAIEERRMKAKERKKGADLDDVIKDYEANGE